MRRSLFFFVKESIDRLPFLRSKVRAGEQMAVKSAKTTFGLPVSLPKLIEKKSDCERRVNRSGRNGHLFERFLGAHTHTNTQKNLIKSEPSQMRSWPFIPKVMTSEKVSCEQILTNREWKAGFFDQEGSLEETNERTNGKQEFTLGNDRRFTSLLSLLLLLGSTFHSLQVVVY